jgi:iron(III) transport system substrate-binding protein
MKLRSILTTIILIALLCACAPSGAQRVVIYTSVDLVFSEPVLQEFTRQTGIQVLPVYDVEAAKTTGLVNRLIAEVSNPQADVFWSSEFAQLLLLKEKGVLESSSPSWAADLPSAFRDPDGQWYGFAGRARVILVNTQLVSEDQYPRSYADLLDERYPADKIGIANPLFGTASNEAAALYARLGSEAGRDFYNRLKQRGVQVLDGNSVVRDQVAAGQLWFGLTDTDDACGAVANGAPVQLIFPEQGAGQPGTLVVPNTVGRIKGGPNPQAAARLIDYLLSPAVEEKLAAADFTHIPILAQTTSSTCLGNQKIRALEIGLGEIYRWLQPAQADLKEIFLR